MYVMYVCNSFKLDFESAVLSYSLVSGKFAASKVPGLLKQSLPKQNWVRLWEGEDYLDLHAI